MTFPLAPTNGDTATVNGISYIYDSSVRSWTRITSPLGNLTVTNNANVTNIYATLGFFTGNVVADGDVYAGANITTTGIVTASGNITGANITTTGNVQGVYVLGNGSKLTNTVTTGKAIAMSIVFGG